MPTLLTYRGDRLGARLCALLNTIKISHQTGIPYKIAWLNFEDYEVNEAEAIFAPEYINDKFLSGHVPEEKIIREESLITSQNMADFSNCLPEDSYFAIQSISGDLKFLDLNENMRAGDMLSSIGWHPSISGSIDKIRGESLSDCCAVHVRRGDLMIEPYSHLPFFEKFAPTILYFEAIRQLFSQGRFQRFIIFSDDDEIIEIFKKEFSFCFSPGEFMELAGRKPLQRDLLEINLMAACGSILAAQQSAFSQVASLIGGASNIQVNEMFGLEDRIRIVTWEVIRSQVYGRATKDLEKNVQMLSASLLAAGRSQDALACIDLFVPSWRENITLLTLYVTACIEVDPVSAAHWATKLVALVVSVQNRYALMKGFALLPQAHMLAARAFERVLEPDVPLRPADAAAMAIDHASQALALNADAEGMAALIERLRRLREI